MRKLKEEEGYTLIIALLMIVLFLSMSAVFIQASLSHAKQEQTVDRANLAVTSAEMGVEYYTGTFKNHMDDAFDEVTNSANNSLLLEYINCKNSTIATVSACREEKRKTAINEFVNKLNTRMTAEIAAQAVNIDRERDTSQFGLQSTSVITLAAENKVKLDFTVLGKSGASEKALDADITFKIPEFFSTTEASTPVIVEDIFKISKNLEECNDKVSGKVIIPCELGNHQDIETVVNLIPSNLRSSAKIKINDSKILCQTKYEYSQTCNPKDLKGVTIYSESVNTMKVYFKNKFSTFNWYHKGSVIIDRPMNRADTILVVESLESESPFNGFSGTFVIVGKNSIKADKKIKPGDSGKMCLNLSGLTLEELGLVKTNFDYNSGGSKGLVYYLIDADKELNFQLANDSSVIELIETKDFLSNCGVQPIKTGDSISFNDFVTPIIELEVEY